MDENAAASSGRSRIGISTDTAAVERERICALILDLVKADPSRDEPVAERIASAFNDMPVRSTMHERLGAMADALVGEIRRSVPEASS